MSPQTSRHVPHKRKNRIGFLGLCQSLLFAALLISANTFYTPAAAADTDSFNEVFNGIGQYEYLAKGAGTRGNPETGAWTGTGEITLNIPDTANIVMARLIWTGRTNAYDADGIQVGMDGNAPSRVTATYQVLQEPWCCNAQQRLESAEITALIEPGTHTYQVSDHEHATNPTGDFLNYGVGIWVIYEDASVDWGKLAVFEGQDSFYRLWTPPRGPHTQVRCFDFDPSPEDRIIETTHFVSGVDTQYGLRSNAFWYMTGSGEKPPADELPGLIGRAGATGYRPTDGYPFQSYSDLEWDNFTPVGGLRVNANDTWICFQVESGDSQNLAGLNNEGVMASGMWGMFAIKVPVVPPTAVTLTEFRVARVDGYDVTLHWETAAETNHFGFNLYRAPAHNASEMTKIGFMPAQASGGAAQGAVYTFEDVAPAAGSWMYWLESVDTSGSSERHDPVTAVVTGQYMRYLPVITKN